MGGKCYYFLELIWSHLCILIMKIKDIVTIDEGAMQLLDDTTVSAEAKYPNNLSHLSRGLY